MQTPDKRVINRLPIVAGTLGVAGALLAWQMTGTLHHERLNRGLIIKVNEGDIAGVQRLLAQGADPDIRDSDHAKMTVRKFLTTFLRSLIHRPLPPTRKPTVLLLASTHPHPEIIRALLQAGAHPDYTDIGGRTALINAAYAGETANIKALLEGHANVNAQDDQGRSALMGAAVLGYGPAVDRLLAGGADTDKKTIFGRTALMWAAGFHYPDVVKSLLANNANYNCQDNEGKSALLYALGDGAPNVVLLPLTSQSPVLSTASHKYKVYFRNKRAGAKDTGTSEDSVHDTVMLLLNANANACVRDKKGRSAMQQANTVGYIDLIASLKAAGAK